MLLFSAWLWMGCREEKPPGSTIWCGDPEIRADRDGDGWDAPEYGGSDCDDHDWYVRPYSADPEGDGLDTDCDGIDGFITEAECPGTPETCDGTDEDCDGVPDDPFRLVVDPATTALIAPLGASGEDLLVTGKTATGTTDGVVDVFTLDGTLLVQIEGLGQGPTFGQQISAGRDLTGDGAPDLAIAAPYATTDLGVNTGRVWLIPGPVTAATTIDDAVGTYEGGDVDGQAGTALTMAPDLDGDGRDELLIGHYRHVLMFSGGPAGTLRTEGADVIWEVNTGGGAWHFGVDDRDEDGDARPELLLGMSTFESGVGVVLRYPSSRLVGDGTLRLDLDDASFVVRGAEGQGLGNRVTGAAGSLWSVSAEGLVEIEPDGTITPRISSVTDFVPAGDADGDGDPELLLERPEALWLWDQSGTLAEAGGAYQIQSDRALGPAIDLDPDGWADPVVLTAVRLSVLDGALAFGSACNADGDAFSSAEDDCDDGDPAASPGLSEVCDGVDNDCDGVVDLRTDRTLGAGWRDIAPWAGVSPLVGLSDTGVVLLGTDGLPGTTVEGTFSTLTGLPDLVEQGTTTLIVAAPAGIMGGETTTNLHFWSAPGVDRAELRAANGLAPTGAVYPAGDLDGDGLGDAWVELRDMLGQRALVRLDATLQGTISVDDLGVRLTAPEPWVELVVGEVGAGSGSDLDGDGTGDLLVGNPSSWNDAGRAMLLTGPFTDGSTLMDDAPGIKLVGEPEEGLGVTLAMGGDLDGDGDDDALIGAFDHARLLAGGTCPAPTDTLELGGAVLVLADGDGDGDPEGYTGTSSETWRGAKQAGTLRRASMNQPETVLRGGDLDDQLGGSLWVVGDLDNNQTDELVYSRAGALWLLGLDCDE